MAEMEIGKERGDDRHGRYVARIPGVGGEAEITFSVRGPDLISADHTVEGGEHLMLMNKAEAVSKLLQQVIINDSDQQTAATPSSEVDPGFPHFNK